MVQATILNTMANISPGFGMIGTLVGLVAMLANLDPSDPSGLGTIPLSSLADHSLRDHFRSTYIQTGLSESRAKRANTKIQESANC